MGIGMAAEKKGPPAGGDMGPAGFGLLRQRIIGRDARRLEAKDNAVGERQGQG
jgi:hypothetical protein